MFSGAYGQCSYSSSPAVTCCHGHHAHLQSPANRNPGQKFQGDLQGQSGDKILSVAHEGHVLLFSLLGNVKGSWEVGLELPPEFSDRVTIAVWQVLLGQVCGRTQLFNLESWFQPTGKPSDLLACLDACHSDHLDFKINIIIQSSDSEVRPLLAVGPWAT